MKTCNRCKVKKEEFEFLDGNTKCESCCQYLKDYYQGHREQAFTRANRSRTRDRDHTNKVKREGCRKNPVSYILWRIKAVSKKYNIPFNLTHADIIVPSHCPVLGIPLVIGNSTSQWGSPSVDRIIPQLGYVKGNITIISHRANTIKSDATSSELGKVLDYVKKTEHL